MEVSLKTKTFSTVFITRYYIIINCTIIIYTYIYNLSTERTVNMKIKDGFILRSVSDAYVVVPLGEAAKTFNGMITLNETGAFLWKKLSESDVDEKSLVDSLLNEYDVSVDLAQKDVSAFVARLRDAQLLNE